MGKLIDLSGRRFGRLVVISRGNVTQSHNSYWVCKCDCGNQCLIRGDHLKKGLSKSCGCLNKEAASVRQTVHGLSGSRLHVIWVSMKQRCDNPQNQAYSRYGEREIAVCDEWKNDFQAFYDWAMTHGYESGLTIDRIDNNKGYSPQNCRWATSSEQARNRRSCHFITFGGETRTMIEWAEKTGLPLNVLYLRIVRYGWPVWRALTEPLHMEKRRKTKL